MNGALVVSGVASSASRENVFVNRSMRPQVGQSIQARSSMDWNLGFIGAACRALSGASRPKSDAFGLKCAGSIRSLIAIRAASHQKRARAPIRLNPLCDDQERLGGIVSLIALNGPLGLQCQVPVRTRLRAAGAFNDIELGLTEVHAQTLARDTPRTANRVCDYCIRSVISG
jgi:hypothetical protein